LPYYLIGAQATREAVDGALEFAEEKLRRREGLSEIEIFDRYLLKIEKFPSKIGLPIHLERYFANLHATSRTIYPSVPSDFEVHPRTHCIRFDTGILVYDEKEFLRAATDIGRGMVLEEKGRKLYEILENAICKSAIPAIKPGVKGKEIYHRLIDAVAQSEMTLKQMQLMHEHTSVREVYKRNVGHLMGRQEPTALGISETQNQEFMEGTVGAVEFPWLFGEYAVGHEDMFFVDKHGAINISAGG
jgi:Xaa-Pro aminopeptidase